MAKTLLDNIERLPNPVLTQIMSAMKTAMAVEQVKINNGGQTSWSKGYSQKNVREWSAIWNKCREVILNRDKNYVDGQEVLDV